jgi:zinc-ribbon domain
MFCPRCGQQQLSDEVRFCPRCGLSLAGVPVLLNEGSTASGYAVAPSQQQQQSKQQQSKPGGVLSGKRGGVRRGAKLMFFSLVLAPIFFLLCLPIDSPAPLIVPVTVFLAGLAVMLYSFLFGEELLPERWVKGRDELGGARGQRELSAPPFVPASSFTGQRVNTAEIAQPPSITEQTTKLLDKD